MLVRLKFLISAALKKNPRTWSWVWNILPHITYLLPHDKSYYGFRHLANKPQGLFLDVGANNGISAAGFRRLNQNYRILSIEASRHHQPALERLKRKIVNFDFVIAGVSSTPGELRLITPIYKNIPIHAQTSTDRDYMLDGLRRVFTPKVLEQLVYDEQVVKVVPIESMNLRPDIVKIDVEGHDFQVLLGMTQTIDRHRPFIMLEFDPHGSGEMKEFFARQSYQLFVYDEKEDIFLSFDEQREAANYETSSLQVNVFAIPAEQTNSLRVR